MLTERYEGEPTYESADAEGHRGTAAQRSPCGRNSKLPKVSRRHPFVDSHLPGFTTFQAMFQDASGLKEGAAPKVHVVNNAPECTPLGALP
jgi:hypothetical protein